MLRNLCSGLIALASALLLSACATPGVGSITIGGERAGDKPPPHIDRLAEVPKGQSSYHYAVTIYPGVGKKFNPNPKLTLTEYNEIKQLDWYCARQADKLVGAGGEMARQGLTYGGLEGFFGALGASSAFGSLISPGQYLRYIGMTAFGGGVAGGKITYDIALNIMHGYCMTGMVYKADENDGELKRIFIVPVYTGNTALPEVVDDPVIPSEEAVSAPTNKAVPTQTKGADKRSGKRSKQHVPPPPPQ